MDIFSGGGIQSSRASKESGIEKYGWNGEIYGSVNTILEVDAAHSINMHEFMKYIGYKRAERRLNTPESPKPKPKKKK